MNLKETNEFEIRYDLDSEHEVLTKRMLEMNPGMGKTVASIRAMRTILESERKQYCDEVFVV